MPAPRASRQAGILGFQTIGAEAPLYSIMRWILIDRFLALEKGRYAKAVKNVTMGEDHLHDHFPTFPVMPNSLIIESLAQTGGILAGYSSDFKENVILAKIESAKFEEMALPGDQLILESEIIEMRQEGCRVDGRVTVAREPSAPRKSIGNARIMFLHLGADNSTFGDAENIPSESFVFSKEFLLLFNLNEVGR